jgi:hypothetical protein
MANMHQDQAKESATLGQGMSACCPSNDYMHRLPPLASEHIIAATHVVAAAGFTFSAVAASSATGSRLPTYATSLFVAVTSLRLILLSKKYAAKTPYTLAGTDMSLLAAVLFVSNALASVATLCEPDDVLMFTAFSALDVTANWLEMVADAKTPILPRYLVLKVAILAAGDGYVAATVAGAESIAKLLWAAFVVKAVVNVISASNAARTILSRDAALRATAVDSKVD